MPVPYSKKPRSEPPYKRLVLKQGPLTARQFRKLREASGETQASLARLFCVTELTVGRWERRQGSITGAADIMLRRLQAEGHGWFPKMERLAALRNSRG